MEVEERRAERDESLAAPAADEGREIISRSRQLRIRDNTMLLRKECQEKVGGCRWAESLCTEGFAEKITRKFSIGMTKPPSCLGECFGKDATEGVQLRARRWVKKQKKYDSQKSKKAW